MINSAQKKIGVAVIILLLIPFIAMRFTNEVNWSLIDFILMAILLTSTGLICEYLNRKITNERIKIATIIGVVILFLFIWGELAVGIFNSPISGS